MRIPRFCFVQIFAPFTDLPAILGKRYQLRCCFKMTSRCFPCSRSGNKDKIIRGSNVKEIRSIYFQNEEIFIQLDELDELDRVTHA